MTNTTQLLETLRALAYDDLANPKGRLRWLLTHHCTGQEIDDVVRDYLFAHWDIDEAFLSSLLSEWVRVEPGQYLSSSQNEPPEATLHEVTLYRPFLLQAHPVTQAQWEALMGANPSHFTGPQRPVEQVTWWEAAAYCNARSRQEGLSEVYSLETAPEDTLPRYSRDPRQGPRPYPYYRSATINPEANGYRLPTELQWEIACRAGTQAATYAGDLTQHLGWSTLDPILDPIAWYRSNSGRQTQDVRQKEPNAWGLYDMLGNVWEWTEDISIPPDDEGQRTNRPSPLSYWRSRYTCHTPPRVTRGGAWSAGFNFNLHTANRSNEWPDVYADDIGFRVAMWL